MFARAVLIMAFVLLCGNLTHAQELTVDVEAVKTLVSKWNEAHTVSTVENFSSLYSNKVNFYGSSLQRERCVAIKRDLLEKQKDFNHTLTGDLFLTGFSTGVIRCDFVKTVMHDSTAADYDAYLIIERVAGKYLIVGESDLITDSEIENAPDFGKRVTIKPLKVETVGKNDHKDKVSNSNNSFTGIFQLVIALGVGVIGLIFVFRYFKKPNAKGPDHTVKSEAVDKKTERNVKATETDELFDKGLAFEKFIVEQFAVDKNFFTLVDWRSDKIHEGIFPQSNRLPDLVYQYKSKDFVRKFSVECKYRNKAFKGSIQLMDDPKFRIYEAYHKTEMPVYIVVGFRGEPNSPAELFLIPFQFVKPEMPYQEMTKFRKNGKFFYDIHTDQLT